MNFKCSTFASLSHLGLNFIRAEGFVYSHVADEGLINACAGDLLRYRRQINAEHIHIFTDIKKKHWSVLTAFHLCSPSSVSIKSWFTVIGFHVFPYYVVK